MGAGGMCAVAERAGLMAGLLFFGAAHFGALWPFVFGRFDALSSPKTLIHGWLLVLSI